MTGAYAVETVELSISILLFFSSLNFSNPPLFLPHPQTGEGESSLCMACHKVMIAYECMPCM